MYWDTRAKENTAKEKLSLIGATHAVLDVRCQQFQQRSVPNHESGSDSDSNDSGDSDVDGLKNMRLGGEDFRLGPLTYGAGRERLEQRHKRKLEQEEQRKERAAKRLQKEQDQASQRQIVAKEAAAVLWKWREHGVKVAVSKLQKKRLVALLLLTRTPGLKGSETNVVLSAAMLRKLVSEGSTADEQMGNMKALVSLFMDVPEATVCSGP